MTVAQRWQYIPTGVLQQADQQDQAQQWGDSQRQALAQVWGDNQRAQASLLLRQYAPAPDVTDTPPAAPPPLPASPDSPGSPQLSDLGLPGPEGPPSEGSDAQGPVSLLGASDKLGAGALVTKLAPTLPEAPPTSPDDPFAPLRPAFDFLKSIPLFGPGQLPELPKPGEPLQDVLTKNTEQAIQDVSQSPRPMVGPFGGLGINAPAIDPNLLGGEQSAVDRTVGTEIKAAASPGPAESGSAPIRAVADMLFGEKLAPPASLPQNAVQRFTTGIVKALFDDRAGLQTIQDVAKQSLGRDLDVDELPAQLSLLSPQGTSQIRAQETIRPALQQVGNDREWLSVYLAAMDNIDVAKAVGARVEAEGMAKDIGQVAGAASVRRAAGAMQAYERQAALVNPDDPAAVAAVQVKAERARGILERAQRTLGYNTEAAEAARNAAASEAGTSTRMNRAFSGGIDITQSQRVIDDMAQELGPQRMAQVEQSAQQFWKLAQDNRRILVQSGLVTPEAAAEWAADYPHYSRTVILDHLAAPENIAAGKKFSVSSTGIRENTVEGTTRAREDPVASMYRQIYQTDALALRNRTFQAIANLRNQVPDLGRVIRQVTDSYQTVSGEEKVMGFVNGIRQTYVLPKDLADLVNFAPRNAIPGLNAAMGVVRAVLASRNPLFAPVHAAITIVPYLERTTTQEGGPLALPRVVTALAKSYVDAFRGITSGTYHGATAEYLKAGGGMFGLGQPNVMTVPQKLSDVTRPAFYTIQNRGDLVRILREALTGRWAESIINRVDYAPRTAAFTLAQRRGENAVQAATAGRTATIDFSKGGTLAKLLNQFIPFFNVGVQAAAQPYRTVRDNPRAALETFLASLVGPAAVTEAWNRSDPQRYQDYQDVPSYYKNSGVVMMLPGQAPTDSQGKRQPQFAYVPLREFAPLTTLTRETMAHVLGEQGTPWAQLIPGILQGISPIPTESGGAALSRFIPGGPLLETPIGLATGKNLFTGGTIASKRADLEASPLAGTVGAATGLRPSEAQFAIGNLGGGYGQLAESASEAAHPKAGNAPAQAPVVGPMVNRFLRGSTGQSFRDAADAMNTPDLQRLLRSSGKGQIAPVSDTLSIGKAELPLQPQERAQYQRRFNTELQKFAQRFTTDGRFLSLPQAEQQEILTLAERSAREAAGESLLHSMSPAAIRPRLRLKADAATAGGGR